MKIKKILSVEQTGGFNTNSQPEWAVTFEAEGKAFKVERIIQFNKPSLHTIQRLAADNAKWFWEFAAKSVVCL